LRSALVAALVSCADSPRKSQARRFVQGLSADELQFIASFLGARVLDSAGSSCTSRAQWAECITRYHKMSTECRSADMEHKMILLLEYLCRRGEAGSQLSAVSSQLDPSVLPTDARAVVHSADS
jgi:hypothetical protein